MVREVKRQAKIGESIKVVNADEISLKYGIKNGDIGIVNCIGMFRDYTNCIGFEMGLKQQEYVVLEECEPTLSEATESELEAELKKRREPKYFTGDVVCIDESMSFRKGKIYEVKNGSLKGDFGVVNFGEVKNVEELNKIACAQFIELVK